VRPVALDGYGVLAGTLRSHRRDRPDNQGRWFHVNLDVDAPLGRYHCAVDVDSKESAVGVQWKVVPIEAALLPAAALAAGYHDLPRAELDGALDLIRHPVLGCGDWTSGSNLEAATALESTLVVGQRVLAFGEPFDDGLGMHNIHQNQGDPYGSRWWDENAIWQDGAIMTAQPDGSFLAFVSKFSSQAAETDDHGHPA